jgi:nucleoside 2-deoxyribosyltransferase
MKVIGGVYREYCTSPAWDVWLGSGGRGAAGLAGLLPEVELHTYATERTRPEIQAFFAGRNIASYIRAGRADYTFTYTHPLSIPNLIEEYVSDIAMDPLSVTGDQVILYGMLEGQPLVRADEVVYDPQNSKPVPFTHNSSSAGRLAYVLNRTQLAKLTGMDDVIAGAQELLRLEGAEVVAVKAGFLGVFVVTADHFWQIPAYYSDIVFKIGSGDVFTAAFGYYWMVRKLPPETAADKASRSVAWYCNSMSLPLPDADQLDSLKPVPIGRAETVYLAGPFFTMAQRWLVDEAKKALEGLGVPVFSPIHDVGTGSAQFVATEDLVGLQNARVVYAFGDGRDLGTIFEVGYGSANGKDIVCYAERLSTYETTMLVGTGCLISNDFASSIYHAAWMSIGPE